MARGKSKTKRQDKVQDKEDKTQEQKAESSADEGKIKSKDAPVELKNKGKLFVGGLCQRTTSKGLETYFSQFGKVIDAVVLRFPESGKSRGFGFVTFANVSDAESVARIDSHVLDEKNIDVRPFASGKPNSKTSKKESDFKVFLGGLPDNQSTDHLKTFFERYGEINEVIIPLDKNTKKPKGYGFLSFKSEDAMEKCLAEDFVHLGGRRIHISTAKPRSSSHSRGAVEIAEDCLESDALSLENLTLWDKMSMSSSVDYETSSTASGEKSEDFFLPKWSNFDAMYRKQTGEEERNFKELLSDFLTRRSIEASGTDENLISFSDASDSEESNSGTHSDCDSYVSGNDYGADAEDTKFMPQLQKVLLKMLTDDPPVGGLNDFAGGDVQTSSPLKFKDSNGSLFCSLCQWTPEANCCESFLDHCRTASHRNKLKDRFPKEQAQTVKHTEGSKPAEKTDSKQKLPAQKSTQGTSKSQDKIQTQGKGLKQNPAEQQQKAKDSEAKAAKKGSNVEIKNVPSNPKPKECENKMNTAKNIKGLKVMALAKGMSCIQPASGEHLKCVMCNKNIPKSEDFNKVMKNVSLHLQSKGHLKNLLETENFLKESLEKSKGETKSSKSGKNPPSQKTEDKALSQEQKVPNQKTQGKTASQEQQKVPNQKTQGKTASQEQQKVPNQKTQGKTASQEQQKVLNQKTQGKTASQEQQKVLNQKTQGKTASQVQQKVPNQKVQDKASLQKQKNVTKETGTKKSQDKSSKLLFLCVPCNYFNSNIELFKAHLKSESHLDCFISRGVSTDLSFDNVSKCKSCEMFLYGSLYYINKHYSKCSENKR